MSMTPESIAAVKAKLKKSMENPKTKVIREKCEFGNDIAIGKKGGVFYERMVTLRYEYGRRLVLQYNGKMPNLRKPIYEEQGKVSEVTDEQLNIIEDAIDSYLQYQEYHLNPYDFLVTYCLVKGIDLIKMDILEV
ncbi:hypothetical protein VP424E501_P0017 [Vibrio phage 424E50-1]|nr:hypothetical protein VP424E501_P0017 [Vibrio phage 424E50-1]